MDKCYRMNPGGRNGDLVWIITFDDNSEITIPFENKDILLERDKHVKKYIHKKRLDKLNKITNKIKDEKNNRSGST
jgi:hypothetical protein